MTYKNGNIFATNSLSNFKNTVLSEIDDLIVCDNIISWLDNSGIIDAIESCTYDIFDLENEIAKNNLDNKTIESFTNFINLFDDFANQDLKYNKLKKHLNNSLVKETWNYFYEYIFWPRFNNKEKFELCDRPQLIVNTKDLLVELKEVTYSFEGYINPKVKTIC